MLTGKELDAMSPEEVRAYIGSVEVSDIDAVFAGGQLCLHQACIRKVLRVPPHQHQDP